MCAVGDSDQSATQGCPDASPGPAECPTPAGASVTGSLMAAGPGPSQEGSCLRAGSQCPRERTAGKGKCQNPSEEVPFPKGGGGRRWAGGRGEGQGHRRHDLSRGGRRVPPRGKPHGHPPLLRPSYLASSAPSSSLKQGPKTLFLRAAVQLSPRWTWGTPGAARDGWEDRSGPTCAPVHSPHALGGGGGNGQHLGKAARRPFTLSWLPSNARGRWVLWVPLLLMTNRQDAVGAESPESPDSWGLRPHPNYQPGMHLFCHWSLPRRFFVTF